jgi:spoIIIJ-associated protein
MENIENQDASAEIKKIIQEAVEGLVGKMNISCEIEIREMTQDGQKNLICNIKTEESNYLIGQYGVNLQALQHIARVIIRKKTQDRAYFVLDVNSYRQEKNESISTLAKSMAEKALVERRSVVLRPMSPYERRLVHMELSKNDQIKTESIGEGEDRRVVIKPTDLV